MGLHVWATWRTESCNIDDCRPRSRDTSVTYHPVPTMPCRQSKMPVSRSTLLGYCAMIWAEPIMMDGAFIGTAVLDRENFRFFPADVRLVELDGLTWGTLKELRSHVQVARLQILTSLARGRSAD